MSNDFYTLTESFFFWLTGMPSGSWGQHPGAQRGAVSAPLAGAAPPVTDRPPGSQGRQSPWLEGQSEVIATTQYLVLGQAFHSWVKYWESL